MLAKLGRVVSLSRIVRFVKVSTLVTTALAAIHEAYLNESRTRSMESGHEKDLQRTFLIRLGKSPRGGECWTPKVTNSLRELLLIYNSTMPIERLRIHPALLPNLTPIILQAFGDPPDHVSELSPAVCL